MEWSTNIIKADRDAKPDLDPRDGLLYAVPSRSEKV